MSRIWNALILVSIILGIQLLFFNQNFSVRAEEQTFFEDNFESYSIGTFPYYGGWEIVFTGMGIEYQTIVDDFSNSPTNSLRLLGRSSWACHAVKRFNTDSPIIGYEVSVLVEDVEDDVTTARVGFWSRNTQSSAQGYALVDFYGGGTIRGGGQVLTNYVPNSWYNIKVILNKETKHKSFWVNDELVLDATIETANPYNIEAFFLASEMFGSYEVYFDDVRIFSVYEANPKLELFPTTGVSQTTLVGSGFAPNSKMVIVWNGTVIPTLPNPLLTDDYGNFTAMISVFNQTTSGDYELLAYDEEQNEATAIFTVIPEFPSWLILPLVLVGSLTIAFFKKKVWRDFS